MQFKALLLAGLFSLILLSEAKGDNEPADSVVYAGLPFVKFDSDLGFIGGALADRYYYEEGVSPYSNLTEVRTQYSTLGMFYWSMLHERLQFAGTDWRVEGEFIFDRMLMDNYFGLGNSSDFEQDQWDEDFYNYESRLAELTLQGRYPLLSPEADNHLDLLLRGEAFYYDYTPFDDNNEALIFNDEEVEAIGDDPFIYVAGCGLLWDSRDREVDTRRGVYSEISAMGSPGLLTYRDPAMFYSAEFRGFYSVSSLDNLIMATRLGGEGVAGDVPFWFMPHLGGEWTLRGYHLRRFRDEGKVYNSFLLRNWLVNFDFLDFRAGLQVFTEGGKTFGKHSGGLLEDFSGNYHHSVGGGLLLSAFTEDFILRVDYAASDETGRLYMNVGYVY